MMLAEFTRSSVVVSWTDISRKCFTAVMVPAVDKAKIPRMIHFVTPSTEESAEGTNKAEMFLQALSL